MSIWNQQYQSGQGRYWPSEEVVRFLGRTYGPMPDKKAGGLTAVDIGCGAGGNTWALAKWGFFVYALDASEEAVAITGRRMFEEKLAPQVRSVCYRAPGTLIMPAGSVSLAVDVQTVQHLTEDEHVWMYQEVFRVLQPGGVFFQVHWNGGKEAEKIFPSHPELCMWDGSARLMEMASSVGFSAAYDEVVSKSYGFAIAQWGVFAWRKA